VSCGGLSGEYTVNDNHNHNTALRDIYIYIYIYIILIKGVLVWNEFLISLLCLAGLLLESGSGEFFLHGEVQYGKRL